MEKTNYSNYATYLVLSDNSGNVLKGTYVHYQSFKLVKGIINNIAYLILKRDLIKFSNTVNPTKYNGAMVLGLNGIVVKSHGSATPEAFAQALKNCLEFIKKDINKLIIEELKMVDSNDY